MHESSGEVAVATQAILRAELAEHHKAISRLNDEIRAIRNFIAADEKNAQHSVEAIRVNAQQSLNNYRNSLAQKQTELHDLQQVMQQKQSIVNKMEEIARKEQEVHRLETEKDRIINLHEKARADLDRLEAELDRLSQPPTIPEAMLIMPGGQHLPLPTQETELLVGCQDTADGIFPAIDLTPFGGTKSGVSRRHATLRLRNGAWTVTDENSTNGTFVNGSRIGAYVPRPLDHRMNLRFGAVEATFILGNAPTAGKTTRLT